MHKIVLATFGRSEPEFEIRQLLEWLSKFHVDSIVELDYGGLATYMNKVLESESIGGAKEDSSIEDLSKSLMGLSRNDGLLAGSGYESVISRWRKVSAFEQAI